MQAVSRNARRVSDARAFPKSIYTTPFRVAREGDGIPALSRDTLSCWSKERQEYAPRGARALYARRRLRGRGGDLLRTPITDKTTPIPATQLAYVKEEIYDYLGVSKEIVENTATPQQEQAFYSGEIAPFFRRLSQAFSNVLFTEREFGYGNRIVFSANSVQFATLPEKVTAAKFLTEIGAATLDQILTMFDMPTIGGEEGARRVQTLNMVNAKLADKYQTGGNTPPDDTTPPGEPTGGKEEG